MARVDLGRVVGYSAYELAVQEGYEGTLQEWLDSLKGADGAVGPAGPAGEQGEIGPQGPAGEDGTQVSVSASGSSTNEVSYITIDGDEYKLAGGGGSEYILPVAGPNTLGGVKVDFGQSNIGYNENGVITAFVNDLPPFPQGSGTFTLRLTLGGQHPVLEWVGEGPGPSQWGIDEHMDVSTSEDDQNDLIIITPNSGEFNPDWFEGFHGQDVGFVIDFFNGGSQITGMGELSDHSFDPQSGTVAMPLAPGEPGPDTPMLTFNLSNGIITIIRKGDSSFDELLDCDNLHLSSNSGPSWDWVSEWHSNSGDMDAAVSQDNNHILILNNFDDQEHPFPFQSTLHIAFEVGVDGEGPSDSGSNNFNMAEGGYLFGDDNSDRALFVNPENHNIVWRVNNADFSNWNDYFIHINAINAGPGPGDLGPNMVSLEVGTQNVGPDIFNLSNIDISSQGSDQGFDRYMLGNITASKTLEEQDIFVQASFENGASRGGNAHLAYITDQGDAHWGAYSNEGPFRAIEFYSMGGNNYDVFVIINGNN